MQSKATSNKSFGPNISSSNVAQARSFAQNSNSRSSVVMNATTYSDDMGTFLENRP